jgi:hypothetical protein
MSRQKSGQSAHKRGRHRRLVGCDVELRLGAQFRKVIDFQGLLHVVRNSATKFVANFTDTHGFLAYYSLLTVSRKHTQLTRYQLPNIKLTFDTLIFRMQPIILQFAKNYSRMG